MPEPLPLFIDRMTTPIGELVYVADNNGKLRALDWSDYEKRMMRLLKFHYGKDGCRLMPAQTSSDLRQAIKRYFAGDIEVIDNIPVATSGTSFQRGVWKALRDIPGGSTISYRKLAERIMRPKAARSRSRQRIKPRGYCNPMSSSYRIRRIAHRLWRRSGT